MKIVTVENLETSTRQEVADFIVHHMLTQNAKAGFMKGPPDAAYFSCVYLAPDGKKCGAGCLFTPNTYRDSFEGFPWCSLVSRGAAPDAHSLLISSFQSIHDDRDVEFWPQALHDLCAREGLQFNFDPQS